MELALMKCEACRPGTPAMSRAEIQKWLKQLDGWDVVARDLDSRGGTTVAPPGREPQRMRPREAYVLEAGTVLDLAQVYAVRFETGAVGR